MARLFDGTNDSLQAASVDLSASNVITVAFWLYWDAYATDNDFCLEFTADVAANNGFAFNPNHASSVFAVTHNVSGGANYTQRSFTRPSAAAWHHYTIVFVGSSATDDQYVYVDGTLQTLTDILVNNGSGVFANSTLNFMCRNNASLFGAGRMAEVGIWLGVQLGQGEATALAKGYIPPLVQPTSLTHYWPLIGRTSPEIELMEGKTATVNGAVQTDHPRVIYSARPHFAAAAQNAPGPSFSPSWAHSWINPVGVAKPADISSRQYMTLAMPPIDLLGSNNPLAWLGGSTTMPVKAPGWPSAHLVRQAPGAPFYRGDIEWFPVGGQLPQTPPRYPTPQPTPFVTPGEAPRFEHSQPWIIPIPKPAFDYRIVAPLLHPTFIRSAFVAPPVATVSCSMTLGDLKTRVYERLDDDGTYYTANEVRHALNAAQNLFALLTLCIERTGRIELSAGTYVYTISATISDFIVPLRVTGSNTSLRVRPVRIHEFDGLSSSWRAATGAPERYAICGYDKMFISPTTDDGVDIVYAAMPTQMTLDTTSPEIPTEQQIHLVDYACWWLRLKEGGQELANAGEWLKAFITAARKYGDFVRRRSFGQKYDTVPFDLASFDMGRLDITLPRTSRK